MTCNNLPLTSELTQPQPRPWSIAKKSVWEKVPPSSFTVDAAVAIPLSVIWSCHLVTVVEGVGHCIFNADIVGPKRISLRYIMTKLRQIGGGGPVKCSIVKLGLSIKRISPSFFY